MELEGACFSYTAPDLLVRAQAKALQAIGKR